MIALRMRQDDPPPNKLYSPAFLGKTLFWGRINIPPFGSSFIPFQIIQVPPPPNKKAPPTIALVTNMFSLGGSRILFMENILHQKKDSLSHYSYRICYIFSAVNRFCWKSFLGDFHHGSGPPGGTWDASA